MKAVLFDMDGVLIDSHDAWFHVLNSALEHFGKKKLTKKEFDEKAWARSFEYVAGHFLKGTSLKEIEKWYFSRFEHFAGKIKIIKNAEYVLRELKKKKTKIAVVSNSRRKIVNLMLSALNLDSYFDAVVGGDEVKNGKPAPDLIIEACRRLKVKEKDAILVGDTVFDIQAGRKAKCLAVGYKIKGDKEIRDLKELLKIC
ncbi:MAG TPA: HAD family phosphatase [Candidatus Nanoarchaeia archaeon]|nr:HAD family phosphatase [Candidatus Nanoarchaeia archaeon]